MHALRSDEAALRSLTQLPDCWAQTTQMLTVIPKRNQPEPKLNDEKTLVPNPEPVPKPLQEPQAKPSPKGKPKEPEPKYINYKNSKTRYETYFTKKWQLKEDSISTKSLVGAGFLPRQRRRGHLFSLRWLPRQVESMTHGFDTALTFQTVISLPETKFLSKSVGI